MELHCCHRHLHLCSLNYDDDVNLQEKLASLQAKGFLEENEKIGA